MSGKLNEFISQVKNFGMARTNRYSVILSPPQKVTSFSGLRQILLYCDQVQLPGINLATTQNRTFGEFREVPYEKLYGDIQMSFYVDTNLYVKSFFDEWFNLIQSPNSRTFQYYNDYIADMEIRVEDLQNEAVYLVNAYECYPKTVSPIQMDYAGKDVMKLQVTMQYKYWTSESNGIALGEVPQRQFDAEDNFLIPESYRNDLQKYQEDWNKAQNIIRTEGLDDLEYDFRNFTDDFI